MNDVLLVHFGDGSVFHLLQVLLQILRIVLHPWNAGILVYVFPQECLTTPVGEPTLLNFSGALAGLEKMEYRIFPGPFGNVHGVSCSRLRSWDA